MKLEKAKKISKTGKYHETFNALASLLPEEITNKCTSKQIAIIIDLMRDQHAIGHDAGYKDAK